MDSSRDGDSARSGRHPVETPLPPALLLVARVGLGVLGAATAVVVVLGW